MSGYKTFAVAGAGNLGKLVVEELLKKKTNGIVSSVAFLTRKSNEHNDLVEKGAKRVVVDYSSQSSIQSALSGIDVVISTLVVADVQEGLAIGAKEAGVKLFVPSEFGNPIDGPAELIWGQKAALKKKLEDEINLPYAVFYNGPWADYMFQRDFAVASGFDFVNGKMVVPGSGLADITWTTIPDVARFVAHVLTALPKEKIEGRHFRIEGERASFNQIIDVWKARTGKNVTVSYRPRSELENDVAKDPKNWIPILILEWDKGNGVVAGRPEELDNNEFPDWKPRKVIDVLVEIYGQ